MGLQEVGAVEQDRIHHNSPLAPVSLQPFLGVFAVGDLDVSDLESPKPRARQDGRHHLGDQIARRRHDQVIAEVVVDLVGERAYDLSGINRGVQDSRFAEHARGASGIIQ